MGCSSWDVAASQNGCPRLLRATFMPIRDSHKFIMQVNLGLWSGVPPQCLGFNSVVSSEISVFEACSE